jgi:hypothetical protein
MIKKTQFKPGQRIVTIDGFEGSIVRRLEYCYDSYEVRLPGGCGVRPGSELKPLAS